MYFTTKCNIQPNNTLEITYTTKAKNRINEIYPETTLPMNDDNRKFKYGQFGYGKYVYSKEELDDMKDFFKKEIKEIFPDSFIKYVI